MAGVGFALSGALPLDGTRAVDLLEDVIDAGYAPVLSTEVCATSALGLTAALAARRPGVPLGTGIVPLAAATDSSIAMGAATAASLSGTTYYLGVGTSTEQIVGGWHGGTYDASVTGTRERLMNLRAVLDGSRRGSFALPKPPGRQVRILLGALGPRMVELGMTDGDGVIVNFTPPDTLPAPAADKTVLAYVWVLVDDESEGRARRDLTGYCLAAPYARHFTSLGYGEVVALITELAGQRRLREAPDALPAEFVSTFYATLDRLPGRCSDYRNAGATPVLLPVTGPEPDSLLAGLSAMHPGQGPRRDAGRPARRVRGDRHHRSQGVDPRVT
ncbi:MAG: LLM class flavin-dependent oxidoreductase [Geodermatophilaceae bacterium]|nr:LLM class flavin-dependent oxidoreductase [Geodermatophilaceae bacterium]